MTTLSEELHGKYQYRSAFYKRQRGLSTASAPTIAAKECAEAGFKCKIGERKGLHPELSLNVHALERGILELKIQSTSEEAVRRFTPSDVILDTVQPSSLQYIQSADRLEIRHTQGTNELINLSDSFFLIVVLLNAIGNCALVLHNDSFSASLEVNNKPCISINPNGLLYFEDPAASAVEARQQKIKDLTRELLEWTQKFRKQEAEKQDTKESAAKMQEIEAIIQQDDHGKASSSFSLL